MDTTILHAGKRLSVRAKNDPEHGIKDYEYVHTNPGNGRAIAILPFRTNLVEGGLEYLVAHEVIPPWDVSTTMCALTGLCDQEDENGALVAITGGVKDIKLFFQTYSFSGN